MPKRKIKMKKDKSASLRSLCLCSIIWLDAIFAAPGQAQTTDTYLPFEGGTGYYRQWSLGPPSNQDYFPIGVWLQSPKNAGLFKSIGVNLFVGLWDGTVETDPSDGPILPLLRQYNMPVIGDQQSGLAGPNAAEHLTDPIIQGWVQQDEPDNAQSNGSGGYTDCIPPSTIAGLYNQFHQADPNRPVFLGLGQGTGFDVTSPYNGRGSTCDSPSRGLNDYPQYIRGADIVSSDVYPENDGHPLWWIGRTTDRLRNWANYQKPAWQWIELVNFNNSSSVALTPAEIQSEVWMLLIHGGLGIGYFVHQFAPVFEEDSIFYPEHAAVKGMVASINTQATALARVLNTPSVSNGVAVQSSKSSAAISVMLKRQGGFTFLFAVNDLLPAGGDPLAEAGPASSAASTMSATYATTGTFTLRDFPRNATAIVLGENRQIPIASGVFSDDFATSYAFHLYQIAFDPNPHAPLAGDLNGDGRVDCQDVQIVEAAMGTTAGQPGYDPRADVIRDGVVNSADLAFVKERGCKPPASGRRPRP